MVDVVTEPVSVVAGVGPEARQPHGARARPLGPPPDAPRLVGAVAGAERVVAVERNGAQPPAHPAEGRVALETAPLVCPPRPGPPPPAHGRGPPPVAGPRVRPGRVTVPVAHVAPPPALAVDGGQVARLDAPGPRAPAPRVVPTRRSRPVPGPGPGLAPVSDVVGVALAPAGQDGRERLALGPTLVGEPKAPTGLYERLVIPGPTPGRGRVVKKSPPQTRPRPTVAVARIETLVGEGPVPRPLTRGPDGAPRVSPPPAPETSLAGRRDSGPPVPEVERPPAVATRILRTGVGTEGEGLGVVEANLVSHTARPGAPPPRDVEAPPPPPGAERGVLEEVVAQVVPRPALTVAGPQVRRVDARSRLTPTPAPLVARLGRPGAGTAVVTLMDGRVSAVVGLGET